MSSRLVETQHVIFEVETLDSELPMHTGLRIYYIPPNEDGTPGLEEDALYVAGTAVEGLNGDSVNQGAPVLLSMGVYSFWAESTTPSGRHCVSPALEALVEQRGTVRR